MGAPGGFQHVEPTTVRVWDTTLAVGLSSVITQGYRTFQFHSPSLNPSLLIPLRADRGRPFLH